MVAVMEEGMFKRQISSRELGMVGGIRDEGSNVLQRQGTSSTWPRLPNYFRKLAEHPVGKRAASGCRGDANWGLNEAQEEEEEGGPGGSMSSESQVRRNMQGLRSPVVSRVNEGLRKIKTGRRAWTPTTKFASQESLFSHTRRLKSG